MARRRVLSAAAKLAAQRLKLEFGSLGRLRTSGSEFEFSIPAPAGSRAGHLIAFSNGDDLWVRFAPPRLCYCLDDADGMLSIMRQLMADQVVFKVVMKGTAWLETTLVRPPHKVRAQPGQRVRLVSWSGNFDN